MRRYVRALAVVLSMPALVRSATISWDAGGNTNSWGTNNNWSNNSAWSSGNTANFDTDLMTNAQYTILLGGSNRTVRNITFGSSAATQGFTFGAGNTLTISNTAGIVNSDADTQTFNVAISLGASQTWSATSGGLIFNGAISGTNRTLTLSGSSNGTIAGNISTGSGGITKTGSGTWTLSGSNSFTGTTTVSTGVLNIRSNTALGGTTAGTSVTSGAALEFQGGISVGNETITLNGTGISSGGALRNVSGNNSTSGGVVLGSTGVRINSDADTLTLTGGISGTNRSLTLGGAGNITVSSGIIATGNGSLTKDGAGTLTLSSNNTYTGVTTITDGVLSVSNLANGSSASNIGSSSNSASNLVFNGGTLRHTTAGADSTNRSFTINNGKTAIIDISEATGNLTISGGAAGTSGALTKIGAGTLTLTGSNGNTGATNVGTSGGVSGGTLAIAGSSERINNNSAVTVYAGTLSVANGLTETIGSLTLGGGASGTTAQVTLGTGSTLTLGGTVTYNATNNPNGATISGGTLGLGANRTFTIGDSSAATADLTISSIISGSNNLTKQGTGTLVLTNANTYTGTTTVSTGVLNIQNNTALGTTANGTSVTSGAALELQGGIAVGNETITLNGTGISSGGALRSVSGNNSISGGIVLGSTGVRINSDANTLTLTGGVTGTGRALTIGGAGDTTISTNGINTGAAGTLTKDGSGTLLLNAGSNYTGTTTVNGGTLAVDGNQSANRLASNAVVQVNNGGTFEIRGVNAFNASSPAKVTVNSGGILNIVSGASTYGGSTSHAHLGDLTLAGGTVNLSYSGSGTAYNAESAQLDGSVTVTANSTIQYGSGANASNAGIALNGNTSFTVNSGVTLNVSAELEDNDSVGDGLTKTGAGTMVLSAANTYTGATTINQGILSISDVANGGLSSHLGSSTNAASNLVFDGGTLQFTGSGSDSTNRNFTINNGKTGTIEVTNPAAELTLSGGSAATSGALTKTGAGTLVLAGNNQHTGTTTIAAGVAKTTNSNSLGAASGDVTVDAGATLALAGGAAISPTNPTNAETITKTGMLRLAGSGVSADTGALHAGGSAGQTSQWLGNITLTGDATISAADNLLRIGDGVSYDDTISLSSHTLTLHTSSSDGVAAYNLAVPTEPYEIFNPTNILINSSISGTGGLTKTGDGTATLLAFFLNPNTYSGETLITGGKLVIDSGGFTEVISSNDITIGNASNQGAADSVVLQMGQVLPGFAAVNDMIKATANMTIHEDGLFNMNGGSNALNSLELHGGHVTGGDPSFNPLLTVTAGITAANSNQTAVIENNNIGMSSNTFTINVANGSQDTDLRIDSVLQNGVGYTAGGAGNALTKSGDGTLALTNANTYSGVTNITAGIVAISDSEALGQSSPINSNHGTVVAAGAQLQLDGSGGNLTIANEHLTLSGQGTGNTGNLRNTGGNNTYNGFISLAGDSRINADAGSTLNIANTSGSSASIINGSAAGRTLTLGGDGDINIGSVIGSNVSTLVKDGAGTVTLSGDYTANTTTTVNNGTLNLNMDGTSPRGLSSSSTITIGDGVAGTATLLLSKNNQISDTAAVSLATDGVFNVNGKSETIGSIAGSGTILLGTGQLITNDHADASTNFSGKLAGAAGSILTKEGDGTLTISSNTVASAGDFTGTINLNDGKLAFTASNDFITGDAFSNSTLNVAAGTTLYLSDATVRVSNLNFTGSGTIYLDFSGSNSILDVTNLTIAAGITLQIINWEDASDYFYAKNWTGGAIHDTTGQAPMNYVVFNSPTWVGDNTKWQSWDDQITPVPEPSTYGAMLIGAMGALLGYRRWRTKRTADGK